MNYNLQPSHNSSRSCGVEWRNKTGDQREHGHPPLPQHRPPKDEAEYHEHRQFEDHLINHRLTWLLGCEALLFAGYAVLLTNPLAAGNQGGLIAAKHQAALVWIPRLGIGVAR